MTVEKSKYGRKQVGLRWWDTQMLDMNGMSKVLVLMDQLDLIITNVV